MTGRTLTAARRGALGSALALAAGVLLALPAWAFFSVLSSGATGVSSAGTLGTPGTTTSAVTATNVTFTITAPPTGPTPTAYRVARTAPTTASTVCTVSGSSGSCSDAAPVQGQTNTYAVYAQLSGSSWESTAPRSVSAVVPSGDTTPPVTTASGSPVANAAGWNSTNVTVTLSATDASGVAATYYTTDGSTPTTASTAYTAPFVVSASATVRYFSVDTPGNLETPKSFVLQIDKSAPTGAVTSPTAGSTVSGSVTVSGTSADTGGSGVASVQPQVQQGSGAWANLGSVLTPGTPTWSTSWVTTTGFPDGAYSLRAVVLDVAGNSTTTGSVSVTVQNTMTVTAPASATAGTAFTVTINGAGVTGTQAITVTGLQSSPNGTAPTVPTSATFTNGAATISVTATRAGSQNITVTVAANGRNATSGNVVVAPKAQGQLYFTSCSGTSQNCAANSPTASTTTARGSNVTFVVARRATDDLGNSLTEASVTVTLTTSSGSTNPVGVTLGAGVATSGTVTYSPPGNSGGTRTVTASGSTTGVANAVLSMTFS